MRIVFYYPRIFPSNPIIYRRFRIFLYKFMGTFCIVALMMVLAGMFPEDATLDTMSRERATIVVESAEVLARYGEQHPERQRAVERMARVDALLEEAVQRNIEGVRSQVRTLERKESQIDEELQKVKDELLERQRLQQQYDEMKLDEERARKLYDTLRARVTEVELQAHSELNDIRIVDRAVTPTRPSSPNLSLNLAVALFVGTLGGVALAVGRHRFFGPAAPVAVTVAVSQTAPPDPSHPGDGSPPDPGGAAPGR